MAARLVTPLRRVEQAEWCTRIMIYLAITYSGVSVLFFTPMSYDSTSKIMTLGWGLFQVVPGVIALISVISRRYMIEWAVVTFIAAGVAMYAFLTYVSVFTQSPNHGGRAGDITALLAFCGARFFYLWKQYIRAATERSARLTAQDGVPHEPSGKGEG